MIELPVIIPDLQISFYYRLREIENLYLGEALRNTVRALDIPTLDGQLAEFVDPQSLTRVSSFGMRGELLFPVPYIIKSNPYLLGYYRLLYGISRKEFYHKNYFRSFNGLEDQGIISNKISNLIVPLCKSLIATGKILFDGIDYISLSIIHSLQVLTIGPQLRGGSLNIKGQVAVQEMYDLIRTIVHPYIKETTERTITLANESGRTVFISFGNDPDIKVQERLETRIRPLVAIEIKGGNDFSNVYNRLGEAEKSHNQARRAGFTECWTIVRVELTLEKTRERSPSTNRLFHLDRIRDSFSEENREFRELFGSLVGIRASL